jgi:phosphatidylglycerophosphate synthase
MNLPNKITMIRIFLIPFMISFISLHLFQTVGEKKLHCYIYRSSTNRYVRWHVAKKI